MVDFMQHYIDRVLNINWKNVGSNKDKDLSLLAYEFIRRMAKFIYDNNFKPISMLRFCSVVAYLTNDFSKIDSKSFFDKYATQSMKENNSISFSIDRLCYGKS